MDAILKHPKVRHLNLTANLIIYKEKLELKLAVILLSGGVDSTTTLAIAKAEGFVCYALSFDYSQRSLAELDAAKSVAQAMGVKEHRIVSIPVGIFTGSALTDPRIAVPDYQGKEDIPITYVPARNTLFLAYALSWADSLAARDIFIGVNAIDYANYPDCRPAYIKSFEKTANLGTKAGISGDHFQIHAPLIHLCKADIIRRGLELGIDYRMTVSCYQATASGLACGLCPSCYFRKKGFEDLDVEDSTQYLS